VADVLSSAEEPTFVTCYDGSGYIHDVHCEYTHLLTHSLTHLLTYSLTHSLTLTAGVMYHGPDTRYTDKEICLVFTGRDIRLLDVSDKCNVVVISTATYSVQSFVHQGWWTSDHTHFVMGDEDDELKYGVATRSLLWDATDLTHVVVVHDYRAGTGAIGE
jgi:choice-of-anchor B domain-containing protein